MHLENESLFRQLQNAQTIQANASPKNNDSDSQLKIGQIRIIDDTQSPTKVMVSGEDDSRITTKAADQVQSLRAQCSEL